MSWVPPPDFSLAQSARQVPSARLSGNEVLIGTPKHAATVAFGGPTLTHVVARGNYQPPIRQAPLAVQAPSSAVSHQGSFVPVPMPSPNRAGLSPSLAKLDLAALGPGLMLQAPQGGTPTNQRPAALAATMIGGRRSFTPLPVTVSGQEDQLSKSLTNFVVPSLLQELSRPSPAMSPGPVMRSATSSSVTGSVPHGFLTMADAPPATERSAAQQSDALYIGQAAQQSDIEARRRSQRFEPTQATIHIEHAFELSMRQSAVQNLAKASVSVYVNVYYQKRVDWDENGRIQRQMGGNGLSWGRKFLSAVIGVYHVGVQVHGKEYTFGNYRAPNSRQVGPQSSGVYVHEKRKPGPHCEFYQAELLGASRLSEQQVENLIGSELSSDFSKTSYNRVYHNCVDFSKTLAQRLGCSPDKFPYWCCRGAEMAKVLGIGGASPTNQANSDFFFGNGVPDNATITNGVADSNGIVHHTATSAASASMSSNAPVPLQGMASAETVILAQRALQMPVSGNPSYTPGGYGMAMRMPGPQTDSFEMPQLSVSAPSSSTSPTLRLGRRVTVQQLRAGTVPRFLLGRIVSQETDGTYSIGYDDATREVGVPAMRITCLPEAGQAMTGHAQRLSIQQSQRSASQQLNQSTQPQVLVQPQTYRSPQAQVRMGAGPTAASSSGYGSAPSAPSQTSGLTRYTSGGSGYGMTSSAASGARAISQSASSTQAAAPVRKSAHSHVPPTTAQTQRSHLPQPQPQYSLASTHRASLASVAAAATAAAPSAQGITRLPSNRLPAAATARPTGGLQKPASILRPRDLGATWRL